MRSELLPPDAVDEGAAVVVYCSSDLPDRWDTSSKDRVWGHSRKIHLRHYAHRSSNFTEDVKSLKIGLNIQPELSLVHRGFETEKQARWARMIGLSLAYYWLTAPKLVRFGPFRSGKSAGSLPLPENARRKVVHELAELHHLSGTRRHSRPTWVWHPKKV